jgi:hypothetical protein
MKTPPILEGTGQCEGEVALVCRRVGASVGT